MAGLTLLGLIALAIITVVIMLLAHQGKEKILKTLGGFIVVIVLYMLFAGKSCGPNAKDVEIMTPQAEAISNYILKNGIPESLAEIPDLPYKLENCNQIKLYSKRIKHQYVEEKSKDGATGEVLKETCVFTKENRTYSVYIRFVADYKQEINANTNLNISIFQNNILYVGEGRLFISNKISETEMNYHYDFSNSLQKWTFYNNPFVADEKENNNNPQIYSTKHDGICNPMRM